MIDVFPLPAFVCGPDGTLLWLQPGGPRSCGGSRPRPRRDIASAARTALYRADGSPIPLDERPVAKVLRTGIGIRDLELIVERRDGSRVTVLANIEPLFDEHRRVVGAVNCMQDITVTRRVEEAWRESEQRLAATYAHAAIGIAEVDENGRLLRVNETACAITGYARDELLQDDRLRRHPSGGSRCGLATAIASRRRAEEDGYVVEKRMIRKDGSVIWVRRAGRRPCAMRRAASSTAFASFRTSASASRPRCARSSCSTS